ncbi:MAG: translesion error-prone DNA polymerase V autoproteolytic subunit [Chitinophagaceae bacterium]|nr:translesion error-prone DNA polymerase V autoproteolytic subunit [Rubrivivax sp.]
MGIQSFGSCGANRRPPCFGQFIPFLEMHHAQPGPSFCIQTRARPLSALAASGVGLVLNQDAVAPRTSVAISFGSPAGDSGVGRLDLNEILVRHPQAAFLMRVAGHSMRGVGIDDGDLALVDRALTAAHGHIVIAVAGDDFVCRRLHRHGGVLCLQASDPACPDLVSGEDDAFQIWGVVTHVVKSLAV